MILRVVKNGKTVEALCVPDEYYVRILSYCKQNDLKYVVKKRELKN